jgi:hypothetical protein
LAIGFIITTCTIFIRLSTFDAFRKGTVRLFIEFNVLFLHTPRNDAAITYTQHLLCAILDFSKLGPTITKFLWTTHRACIHYYFFLLQKPLHLFPRHLLLAMTEERIKHPIAFCCVTTIARSQNTHIW